ncbi:MAG TPA: hypothetical protein VMY35_15895 [Phycisphaerae bacterium]|nr:hypothetical protein [Phycisphaerae bacterium]
MLSSQAEVFGHVYGQGRDAQRREAVGIRGHFPAGTSAHQQDGDVLREALRVHYCHPLLSARQWMQRSHRRPFSAT